MGSKAMLTGLTIRRFRGIRELELEGLAQVNVLLGRNNAGKSSVLEALCLASASLSPVDPVRETDKMAYLLNRRGDRGLSPGMGWEVLWFGYDQSEDVVVELEFDGITLEVRLTRDQERPTLGFHAPAEMKNLMNRLYVESQEFLRALMFIDAALLRDIKQVERTLWTHLLRDRSDKLVVEVLRGGYGVPVEDLTYAPFGRAIQLVAKLPHTSVRVDDLGDGARYALVMVMAAALARRTLLLIEEPESHQHPGGLAKTLEMLLSLAKKNETQLFMTTHSLELVRLTEAIGREVGISLATFFLERSEDGLVSARRVEAGDRELLAELGLDVRFLDVI